MQVIFFNLKSVITYMTLAMTLASNMLNVSFGVIYTSLIILWLCGEILKYVPEYVSSRNENSSVDAF